MAFELGPRRGVYIDIAEEMKKAGPPLSDEDARHFESFDLIYRSLCALLYNYVPMSGHPGGSISSGPIVQGILFDILDYDLKDPDRLDADILSYAAGHKALGLYAMWALRNEIARAGAPELLPKDERKQLRLEDLLGFRRNPGTDTPLFKKYSSKALDGHPTPSTPFLRLSTGASGVGVATSIGLAYGAKDYYGAAAPRVHILEGEGGMTPGRVAEALAAAGTASLGNAYFHLDWNQASIDSNRVCREGTTPGDYVQWTPAELLYLHDWNVIYVEEGRDFRHVAAAQRKALAIDNGQPTSVVYRTVKGWHYGIQGRASHGAGHKLCSDGFYAALDQMSSLIDVKLPRCCDDEIRCKGPEGRAVMEECFWEALQLIRKAVEAQGEMVEALAGRLLEAQGRLNRLSRQPRTNAPNVEKVYRVAADLAGKPPAELALRPGTSTTLRGELGRALGYYNKESGGALLAAAADLLGSTSINLTNDGFAEGYWHTKSNPEARLLSIGGICEDAMMGILGGLSTYGRHIGVGSSYGAFLAPLGHIAARLHAIGNQARREISKEPYKPVILVCAHAGLKTGEDGPTHADPQALQLLEENFPAGTLVTLTPWDSAEVWPLLAAAIAKRPAVIAPFVTRPNETVPDRNALRLAPAADSVKGVYLLRAAKGKGDGTVVLQESGVTVAFVEEALPLLEKEGIDLNVYYVASAELFDMLPREERSRIFPEERSREAMGITGFTLPTLYRWVTSEHGRRNSMHPFQKGRFLGSGQADMVLKEAGLDGRSQFEAIRRYVGQAVRA
jgi:transketolase